MKIKDILSNPGLKICSLLFAIILWFLITNINDPVVTVRFYNIPVTIKNTDVITDAGNVYQVLDNTDNIGTVTVLAPRSVADSFSKDNIVASADVDELTNDESMEIHLSVNKYSNEVESISGSISTTNLSIETKKTKTLALGATTSGTVSDGYIVDSVSTDQNLVRISGPESVVDNIASASVDVDVTGFTSDIDTDADIKFYDADGKEVSDSQITKNIDSVGISVTILQTKYVDFNYEISGTPAEGYMTTGQIDSSPEQVLIAGKSSTLSSIDSLDVSDEELNVNGLSDNLDVTVDVSDDLPSGVKFGDKDFNGVVSVVVHIEKSGTETIKIPLEDIKITNVPDGYTASLLSSSGATALSLSDTCQVVIHGLAADTQGIDAGDISGSIDLSSLTEEDLTKGSSVMTVEFTLPDGITQIGDTSVSVKLESAADASTSASSASSQE